MAYLPEKVVVALAGVNGDICSEVDVAVVVVAEVVDAGGGGDKIF